MNTLRIGRPFDIIKTLITTLTLCLVTSLFADGKEAELKKRIAGCDAKKEYLAAQARLKKASGGKMK